jgi:hypothetical protein
MTYICRNYELQIIAILQQESCYGEREGIVRA